MSVENINVILKKVNSLKTIINENTILKINNINTRLDSIKSDLFAVREDIKYFEKQKHYPDRHIFVKNLEKSITIKQIASLTAEYYKMDLILLEELFKSLKETNVNKKHICFFFGTYLSKENISEIGKYCGNRSHSTVTCGVKTIYGLYQFDKKIKNDIDNINISIQNKYNTELNWDFIHWHQNKK